jgi:hypothetical protein
MSRRKPLSSTLFSIAAPQLIFLSLMTWEIILNRVNDFCLQEIQVTSFPALSKQSRKKGSLHSICEAAEMLEMTMTLTEMLEIPI